MVTKLQVTLGILFCFLITTISAEFGNKIFSSQHGQKKQASTSCAQVALQKLSTHSKKIFLQTAVNTALLASLWSMKMVGKIPGIKSGMNRVSKTFLHESLDKDFKNIEAQHACMLSQVKKDASLCWQTSKKLCAAYAVQKFKQGANFLSKHVYDATKKTDSDSAKKSL